MFYIYVFNFVPVPRNCMDFHCKMWFVLCSVFWGQNVSFILLILMKNVDNLCWKLSCHKYPIHVKQQLDVGMGWGGHFQYEGICRSVALMGQHFQLSNIWLDSKFSTSIYQWVDFLSFHISMDHISYFKHILLFNNKQFDRTQVSQLWNVFSQSSHISTYPCSFFFTKSKSSLIILSFYMLRCKIDLSVFILDFSLLYERGTNNWIVYE